MRLSSYKGHSLFLNLSPVELVVVSGLNLFSAELSVSSSHAPQVYFEATKKELY